MTSPHHQNTKAWHTFHLWTIFTILFQRGSVFGFVFSVSQLFLLLVAELSASSTADAIKQVRSRRPMSRMEVCIYSIPSELLGHSICRLAGKFMALRCYSHDFLITIVLFKKYCITSCRFHLIFLQKMKIVNMRYLLLTFSRHISDHNCVVKIYKPENNLQPLSLHNTCVCYIYMMCMKFFFHQNLINVESCWNFPIFW